MIKWDWEEWFCCYLLDLRACCYGSRNVFVLMFLLQYFVSFESQLFDIMLKLFAQYVSFVLLIRYIFILSNCSIVVQEYARTGRTGGLVLTGVNLLLLTLMGVSFWPSLSPFSWHVYTVWFTIVCGYFTAWEPFHGCIWAVLITFHFTSFIVSWSLWVYCFLLKRFANS